MAFDLKIGSFEPEHAGKLDFYLNLLNEKERAPDDQPSIGIILCAEKDDVEVEFALKTKANPIGVHLSNFIFCRQNPLATRRILFHHPRTWPTAILTTNPTLAKRHRAPQRGRPGQR